MENKTVHIALAADRRYLPFAAIAVASGAANTVRPIVFHFLHEDLTDLDLRAFDFLEHFPHASLRVHKISDAFFRDWPAMRWSRAIYYRLILPDLLPDLEKIIYLDSDLLVLRDLSELFDTPFDGASCMAVVTKVSHDHTRLLGIPPERYFNSGVLVFSPVRWKLAGCAGRFKECIANYADRIKYPDQDILNLVFQSQVRFLHPRWNIITSTFRNEPVACYTAEQIMDALAHPGIAHFTGSHKPWRLWKTFRHPYSLAMKRYAAIAGRRDIALRLSLKSLFLSDFVPPVRKLPWDSSVIDRSLLR